MRICEIIQLDEKRANPKANPKQSAYEQVRKYVNEPDTFIHFSKIQKLGVNPGQSYKTTPFGIYGYPIKDFWAVYKMDVVKDFKKTDMFATEYPYIIIFKWNGKGKFASDMNQYSKQDFQQDLAKLSKIYTPQQIQAAMPDKRSRIEKTLSNVKSKMLGLGHLIDTPIKTFWGLTFLLANRNITQWSNLLRRLGYAGFCDHGTSTIHPGEPYQAVFFDRSFIQELDFVNNQSFNTIDYMDTRASSKYTGKRDFDTYNDITQGFNLDYANKDQMLQKASTQLDNVKRAIASKTATLKAYQSANRTKSPEINQEITKLNAELKQLRNQYTKYDASVKNIQANIRQQT
jgi:hypothetical protein